MTFQRDALSLIFGGLLIIATLLSACSGGRPSQSKQAPPTPRSSHDNPMHIGMSIILQPAHPSISRRPYHIYLNTSPPASVHGCHGAQGTITIAGTDEAGSTHTAPPVSGVDYQVCR